MIIFNATFKKNDGTRRQMKFARLVDLPNSKRPTNKTKLQSGQELVWDVQNNAYRVFNWKTVIGKVVAEQV